MTRVSDYGCFQMTSSVDTGMKRMKWCASVTCLYISTAIYIPSRCHATPFAFIRKSQARGKTHLSRLPASKEKMRQELSLHCMSTGRSRLHAGHARLPRGPHAVERESDLRQRVYEQAGGVVVVSEGSRSNYRSSAARRGPEMVIY